jgi:Spy/CpxP family protein refolding chaperone
MNRYRLFTLGTALIFALAAHAQQPTTTAGASAKDVSSGEDVGLPTVETQLKVLTEKLSLTTPQQNKIKPILQDLHEATEKLAQDKNLSHEERLAKVRPQRYKADERIRAILNDDQKKMLDQYEQGPHPEMHGNLTGATPPSQRPPKF